MQKQLICRETDQEDQIALQALTDSIIVDATGQLILPKNSGIGKAYGGNDEDLSELHMEEGLLMPVTVNEEPLIGVKTWRQLKFK